MPTTTTNNEDDLRQLAILIHKMKFEQILHSLWEVYLQSGMGQLNGNIRIEPSVWPTKVKTSMRQTIQTGMNENDACRTFVQDRLHGFHTRIQQYQTELDRRKNNWPASDRERMYQMIEKFIEGKLEVFRRKIQHQIHLVHYDYKDRMLELKFLQQNPSEYCVRHVNRIDDYIYFLLLFLLFI